MKIGLIGLGIMGKPMAKNILKNAVQSQFWLYGGPSGHYS